VVGEVSVGLALHRPSWSIPSTTSSMAKKGDEHPHIHSGWSSACFISK